ncbi:WD40 repeat domain-containing protein [Catalinimonas niigatensis]|uniref:WD40 repeat domain-containing protein n=1 Tax=Catalinimonas niigatensis TaxID=1397264 RepID=UPI0026657918|nr:WD40 repeat domain-containing protein [Catalinimonas niigatensis]WPP48055.1 WD40 repeat domain-containing protein [Catalinimonas niigatensis]
MNSMIVQVDKLHTLRGHKDGVYTLTNGPQDAIFFSGAGDGLIVRWNLDDAESGKVIAKVPGSVYAIHYERERNNLIIGENHEGIHIVNLDTKKELGAVKTTGAAIFDIKTYQEDIIVASGEGMVTVLNYQNLSIQKQWNDSIQSVRSIAINPLAKEMAVGFSDNKIRVYDLKTYKRKYEIEAHTNSVFTLTYSPDYRWLLSGSRDAHLKVWNVNEHYELQESIVAHMYCINHIEYSPEGKYFATCSMDKSVKIWDSEQFKLLKVIDKARHAGHGTSVNRLLWSKHVSETQKNPLISAGDDRSISVWQVDLDEKKNDYQ